MSDLLSSTKKRFRHTQWAKAWGWQMFNVNLGTGAISIVIGTEPYPFNGQHAIGTVFFILNIVLYLINVAMMITRAIRYPRQFKQSFFDQAEGVWFPVVAVAMSTLLTATIIYGVPFCGDWLIVACEVWYWIYIALAAITALVVQSTLRTMPRDLKDIAPCDALEVYPLMFGGVVGATLVPELVKVSPERALTMLIFSFCMQGLGFFIGVLKLSVWMVHDMTLPTADPKQLPGYLISVGVPGFTAYALVGLGNAALQVIPANNFLSGLGDSAINPILVAQIIFVACIWFTWLLLGMATWFILVFVFFVCKSFVMEPTKPFSERWTYTWWAWTFPLTGVVITFARFATYFPAKAFGVLNVGFILAMTTVWFINVLGTAKMVWAGDMPGTTKDLDMDKIQRLRRGETVDSE